MFGRHFIPQRLLVAQELRHRIRLRPCRCKAEKTSQCGPHVLPAEEIPVIDIERLIAAAGSARNPDRRPGKQLGVRDLKQRLEATYRAGETEWLPELAQHRAIDCE